ncbi:hypothetical protein I3842_11G028100 [Carya illinoinensis]|uniref:Uncharacterized protein n=1 Tax=Carya illinoinensis TaxID=32201 RepID=A0A922DLM9_CARIL|nr:hypothetical protein I3842_11G028100 [Carya illinoinensis]
MGPGAQRPNPGPSRITISFNEKDEEGILHPHDDALVVTMQVVNFTLQRILVNNGSSPSILRQASVPLKGFTGDVVQPMGVIPLSVLSGKAPRTQVTMADFLVVKALSSYNAIVGRPTLNNLRVVTSTYHFKMKFPTNLGVGEIRGEQVLARECYARKLRHEVKMVASANKVGRGVEPSSPCNLAKWDKEIWDEEALCQVEPNEPLKLVSVDAQRLGPSG